MNHTFTPMTDEYARQILTWKYKGQYAQYDYENEAEHILDTGEWGNTLFAVLDETNTLIGELSFGFLDESDEWISQTSLEAGQTEGAILWVGFGLRPDLTGKGLGLSFVNACTDYAIKIARQRYAYRGEWVGLGVFQFNQRAIKVYERAGYVKFSELMAEDCGKVLPAQRMKKKIGG